MKVTIQYDSQMVCKKLALDKHMKLYLAPVSLSWSIHLASPADHDYPHP